MTSLETLLSGLIDYAGLFPPASLTMREAVSNYANYLQSNEQWILGRFVLPAARLAEFEDTLVELGLRESPAWRVSLLGSPAEAAKARHDNDRAKTPVTIDTLETKLDSASAIAGEAKLVPPGMTAFFEIPFGNETAIWISACASAGVCAKLRTGGLTPDKIPRVESLARALAACCHAKVPFKATAGLHRPLRSFCKLADSVDAPSGTMHGFMNVFLAAALLQSGGSQSDAMVTLRGESPEIFDFEPDRVRWHGLVLSKQQLKLSREQFSIGFGSCSFSEPIGELKKLGWI